MDSPRFHRVGSEPRHEIEPLSLLFVVSGQLKVRLADGEATRVRRGELLVLRRSRAQVVGSSLRDEALAFQADAEWIRGVGGCELAALDAGDPVALEPAGSDLALRAHRLLCEGRLFASEAPANHLERTARSLELVAIALGARGSLASPRAAGCASSPHLGAFVRALEGLGSDGFDECSLGRLAQRLGLSERQVARLFRRTLGTSYSAYATQLRIDHAKKLLESGQLSVTEIGLETGWQSLSHFGAVFRRRVGVSPRAYRARARGNPPAALAFGSTSSPR